MMEIVGDIKTYDWGKLGSKSEVAKLAVLNTKDLKIDENTPYAELWMGDHVSGPAKLKANNKSLSEILDKSQIGGHEKLPFLLKVLSVRKALSIQVHPNKAEAEKLHKERPDIYKDSNHKPELAIALTPFLAMCGFRPYNEISEFLKKIQPLKELVGGHVDIQGLPELKACFSNLMKSKEENVAECIDKISKEYISVLKEYKLYDVFTTINNDFPNDVGILCLFFLNVLHLDPGQAIFLSANVPHAYLDGDCVECMACSDNVIRAGLTPKYKDVETLLSMLNYEGQSIEETIFKTVKEDAFSELFIPKIKDFAVAKLHIPSNEVSYKWKNRRYGSIIIVVSGERIMKTNLGKLNLQRGVIAFIPGNCGDFIEFLQSSTNADENFTGYLAMYNSFCFCDK